MSLLENIFVCELVRRFFCVSLLEKFLVCELVRYVVNWLVSELVSVG